MTAMPRGAGWAGVALLGSLGLLLAGNRAVGGTPDGSLRFDIHFGEELCPDALDGRLLLLLSTDDSQEPRFQIEDGPETQLAFDS